MPVDQVLNLVPQSRLLEVGEQQTDVIGGCCAVGQPAQPGRGRTGQSLPGEREQHGRFGRQQIVADRLPCPTRVAPDAEQVVPQRERLAQGPAVRPQTARYLIRRPGRRRAELERPLDGVRADFDRATCRACGRSCRPAALPVRS